LGRGLSLTIFRVPVALADFLTKIDQHDNEPRSRNAAQQAVTELSDFEKQKSRRNAAKRSRERGQRDRNGSGYHYGSDIKQQKDLMPLPGTDEVREPTFLSRMVAMVA
jgi:hypothetical protein